MRMVGVAVAAAASITRWARGLIARGSPLAAWMSTSSAWSSKGLEFKKRIETIVSLPAFTDELSVLQLPYPRPRDWPPTPPPARVPASAPRKVPIGVGATFDLQQDLIFGQPTRLQYQITSPGLVFNQCLPR